MNKKDSIREILRMRHEAVPLHSLNNEEFCFVCYKAFAAAAGVPLKGDTTGRNYRSKMPPGKIEIFALPYLYSDGSIEISAFHQHYGESRILDATHALLRYGILRSLLVSDPDMVRLWTSWDKRGQPGAKLYIDDIVLETAAVFPMDSAMKIDPIAFFRAYQRARQAKRQASPEVFIGRADAAKNRLIDLGVIIEKFESAKNMPETYLVKMETPMHRHYMYAKLETVMKIAENDCQNNTKARCPFCGLPTQYGNHNKDWLIRCFGCKSIATDNGHIDSLLKAVFAHMGPRTIGMCYDALCKWHTIFKKDKYGYCWLDIVALKNVKSPFAGVQGPSPADVKKTIAIPKIVPSRAHPDYSHWEHFSKEEKPADCLLCNHCFIDRVRGFYHFHVSCIYPLSMDLILKDASRSDASFHEICFGRFKPYNKPYKQDNPEYKIRAAFIDKVVKKDFFIGCGQSYWGVRTEGNSMEAYCDHFGVAGPICPSFTLSKLYSEYGIDVDITGDVNVSFGVPVFIRVKEQADRDRVSRITDEFKSKCLENPAKYLFNEKRTIIGASRKTMDALIQHIGEVLTPEEVRFFANVDGWMLNDMSRYVNASRTALALALKELVK